MFYIREIRPEGCIVVDTNDGVAELASRDLIISLVSQGTRVYGVSSDYDFKVFSNEDLEVYYSNEVGKIAYNRLTSSVSAWDLDIIMDVVFKIFKTEYDRLVSSIEDLSQMELSSFICRCLKVVCELSGVSIEALVEGYDMSNLYKVYESHGVAVLRSNTVSDKELYFKVM